MVQGSKTGGFHYTVFNIETVFVPRIMREPEFFREITGNELEVIKDVGHDVSQYVDDSTNSIGTRSLKEMEKYVKQFLNLLKNYYDANKLRINQEKAKLMIMGNGKRKKKLSINWSLYEICVMLVHFPWK